MKTFKMGLLAVAALVAFVAFRREDAADHQRMVSNWADTVPYRHYDTSTVYIDPSSGDTVELWYDHSTHELMNRRNRQMVNLYVDPATNDTFYGEGYVVNNLLIRMPNGKYRVDTTKVKITGNKIKYKDGADKGKVKMVGNKIKAKDNDEKIKTKNGDTVKIRQRNG